MGYEFNFENLKVYQEAIALSTHIYKLTSQFPKNEVYGLTNQIRRACVSVVSNICEGSSRGKIEFKRFLDISRGSIFECVGQIRIAFELKYINETETKELYSKCLRLSKMLMALRKSI